MMIKEWEEKVSNVKEWIRGHRNEIIVGCVGIGVIGFYLKTRLPKHTTQIRITESMRDMFITGENDLPDELGRYFIVFGINKNKLDEESIRNLNDKLALRDNIPLDRAMEIIKDCCKIKEAE